MEQESVSRKSELKKALKEAAPESRKIIKYFFGEGGCLTGSMTDDEYDTLVKSRADSAAVKKHAADTFNIDGEGSTELDPICFEGYLYDGNGIYTIKGKDGVWRSTLYEVSWIFFGTNYIYIYRETFDIKTGSSESAHEKQPYTDIVNLSIVPGIVPKLVVSGPKTMKTVNVDNKRFALITAGGKFFCAMTFGEYTENAMRSMKSLLRDKKKR